MRNKNTTLAIRLFSVINDEAPTSTNYHIARFLLENIQTLDISTTESLAQQCNASKASISRFCKTIGLNDFFELKSHVLHFKTETRRKMEFPYHESVSDMRKEFINDIIVRLTMMRDCMEDAKLDELIRDLQGDRPLTAMGHMQSGNTAQNMQYNLFTCNKTITALTRSTSQIDYFRKASARDIAVIFSVSGDFMENLFYGEPTFATGRKPKIYLITTNPKLEKKSYVDILYNCKTGWSLSGGNASLEFIQQLISLSYYYNVRDTL